MCFNDCILMCSSLTLKLIWTIICCGFHNFSFNCCALLSVQLKSCITSEFLQARWAPFLFIQILRNKIWQMLIQYEVFCLIFVPVKNVTIPKKKKKMEEIQQKPKSKTIKSFALIKYMSTMTNNNHRFIMKERMQSYNWINGGQKKILHFAAISKWTQKINNESNIAESTFFNTLWSLTTLPLCILYDWQFCGLDFFIGQWSSDWHLMKNLSNRTHETNYHIHTCIWVKMISSILSNISWIG